MNREKMNKGDNDEREERESGCEEVKQSIIEKQRCTISYDIGPQYLEKRRKTALALSHFVVPMRPLFQVQCICALQSRFCFFVRSFFTFLGQTTLS